VEEVLSRVEEDNVFFRRSGGGLTLSGGEAMFQAAFTLELLSAAKVRHMDTALETSGLCDYENLKEAAKLLDSILYDLKHWDGTRHSKVTGGDNRSALQNLGNLVRDFPKKKITVRIPVIPKFNDTKKDLLKIKSLVPSSPNVNIELLPYHRLGEGKYSLLGRSYPYQKIFPSQERFNSLKSFFYSH
jgi:pyruvate formate lyase activating enzyme